MAAIVIENLEKWYKKRGALKGITLHIKKGSIFGLLGSNGAGKSTLIKSLVGSLRPTKGKVMVLGHDPLKDRYELRKKIGYMPQESALYEDLSAYENIRFFGLLHEIVDLEKKIARILDFTELTDRADDRVRTFSGGMKKRVSLACALLHEPEIIFLDEPTAAVDPQVKVKTWHLFRKIAARGITLIVSTHLMDEALLCDMLGVMHDGSLIAHDTPEKILEHGRMYIDISKGSEHIKKTIPAQAKDLAHTLKEFGLDIHIDAVGITSDSLEHIILELLHKRQS